MIPFQGIGTIDIIINDEDFFAIADWFLFIRHWGGYLNDLFLSTRGLRSVLRDFSSFDRLIGDIIFVRFVNFVADFHFALDIHIAGVITEYGNIRFGLLYLHRCLVAIIELRNGVIY